MPPTPPATTLRDAIRALIVAHGALDPSERPCGTPLPAPWAWSLLELQGGPRTISELAGRLNIDRTNVSRLAARMEAAGDVERVPHPEDGRARLLVLTDRGRHAAAAVDRASAARFREGLSRLDVEPDAVLEVRHALIHALSEETT